MRKTQTPTPSNDHETDAPKPRDRHGERSVPPPLEFDLFKLPDSTLITVRHDGAKRRLPCRSDSQLDAALLHKR